MRGGRRAGPATAASWPTTALATSARTASRAARASGAAASRRDRWSRGPNPRRAGRPGAGRRLRRPAGAGARTGGLVLVGHERADPLLEIGQCVGQGVQFDIGGGRRAGEQRRDLGGRHTGGGSRRSLDRLRRLGRQGEAPRQPLGAAEPQDGRGAGAVAGPAVDPAAALGGLDGAHDDGERLGDEGAHPPARARRRGRARRWRARRRRGRARPARRWACVRRRRWPGHRSPAGTRRVAGSGRAPGSPGRRGTPRRPSGW